jgi:ATP-dependent helicase Lhr and Lhr-like helicase
MADLDAQRALLHQLPRTWQPFFARHGSFTNAQAAAIPLILAGHHVVLCAATASGKTEAALAPLIERHCPPVRRISGLAILYITPTRALANNLAARLAHPLETLGLQLAIRTGDSRTASRRPADVLITTPESADSLLASQARLFRELRAIVLDELHILDATPRGDQLRAVLRRIERIRSYAMQQGDAADAAIQYVALSATLANPEAVAARYVTNPTIITIASKRQLQPDLVPLSPLGAAEIVGYLSKQRQHWRKVLFFCNSRAEIETYAAALRATNLFGAIFVHYSNIDAKLRRETEQRFAEAEYAICLASGTLELGIDIGTIDLIGFIGPPGSWSSFAQRVGRGGRRNLATQIACFYRTSLEEALFGVLIQQYGDAPLGNDQSAAFHPAVVVQQIFSMLKQSPTAAVRLAELTSLFDSWVSQAALEAIAGELIERGYLTYGRPGEWRAGTKLNELIDSQASSMPGPSIHSTIQANAAARISLYDQQTGQAIAHVAASWFTSEQLIIDGKAIRIEWSDGRAVLVRPQAHISDLPATPLYQSARQPLSYALARLLPEQFGVEPDTTPLVPYAGGWAWFHFLGELYGQAVLDLLRYTIIAEASSCPGICLLISEPLQRIPEWPPAQVQRYLADQFQRYESLLAIGQFQQLLPLAIRKQAVADQFAIGRFLAALQTRPPAIATPATHERLLALLDE